MKFPTALGRMWSRWWSSSAHGAMVRVVVRSLVASETIAKAVDDPP
jgi:hypothetical protein